MNLRKLKCLPFDRWATWNRFGGVVGPDDLFADYAEIPAVFSKPDHPKPGRYYDRDTRTCWYELPDGRAYRVDPEPFLHALKMTAVAERPLTDHERQAIHVLVLYNNAAVKELADRLYHDDCERMGRRIYRNARRHRLQILGR